MTKVVLAMSVSLDGIAGPEAPDADGMALFAEILGWQFPLRSWRAQQGQEGGEDSVDSKVWQAVFVVTHRGQDRIAKGGGTSYTFVTGGITEAVGQARAVADGKDVLLAGVLEPPGEARRPVPLEPAGEPRHAAADYVQVALARGRTQPGQGGRLENGAVQPCPAFDPSSAGALTGP